MDASAVDGKTSLAGNLNDNTIIAGDGDSSLWGGDGGNDLLVGGGKNTFFYNFGNGNDTIQSANDGDIVDLTNITLAEISSTNISADAVSINFIDGGSLTVNGNAAVEYKVDGTSYVVDNGKLKIK